VALCHREQFVRFFYSGIVSPCAVCEVLLQWYSQYCCTVMAGYVDGDCILILHGHDDMSVGTAVLSVLSGQETELAKYGGSSSFRNGGTTNCLINSRRHIPRFSQLKEIRWKDVYWIHLAQNIVQWPLVLRKSVKFRPHTNIAVSWLAKSLSVLTDNCLCS